MLVLECVITLVNLAVLFFSFPKKKKKERKKERKKKKKINPDSIEVNPYSPAPSSNSYLPLPLSFLIIYATTTTANHFGSSGGRLLVPQTLLQNRNDVGVNRGNR